MTSRIHGTVRRWNDERGFGFVEPADGTAEVFAHISTFPRGARPQVGDLVSFLVGTDERGRRRAMAVQVPPARRQPATSRHSTRARAPSRGRSWAPVLVAALLAGVGTYAYPDFRRMLDDVTSATVAHPGDPGPAASKIENALPQFHCDGRIHCSQMTSCEEATFFLRHCPGTKMDGDHDGVPCEQQHCR